MRTIRSTALQWEGGSLRILDQTLLPLQEKWISVETPEEMVECIQALRVRGAPLIGVAAALTLGRFYSGGASKSEFRAAATLLSGARPTAVNLSRAVTRVVAARHPLEEAERIFDEDVELCEAIGRHGAELLRDGDTILTHCNAGSLATAGIGTAIGIIDKAFQTGKRLHVFVGETRPLLQGARLTAWELKKLGIPHTLICDNMAAALMGAGEIHKVIVGADRIAANGDFANKTGTYGLAVSAHFHEIPFYVAAPYTSVDRATVNGKSISVERRNPREVRGFGRGENSVIWSPEETPCHNPAFDVTPARLVTRFILDTGVFSPEEFAATTQLTKPPMD